MALASWFYSVNSVAYFLFICSSCLIKFTHAEQAASATKPVLSTGADPVGPWVLDRMDSKNLDKTTGSDDYLILPPYDGSFDLSPVYVAEDDIDGSDEEPTVGKRDYRGPRGSNRYAEQKRAPASGFWGARGKRAPPSGFWGARGKRAPPSGFWGARGKRGPPSWEWIRGRRAPPSGFWGARG